MQHSRRANGIIQIGVERHCGLKAGNRTQNHPCSGSHRTGSVAGDRTATFTLVGGRCPGFAVGSWCALQTLRQPATPFVDKSLAIPKPPQSTRTEIACSQWHSFKAKRNASRKLSWSMRPRRSHSPCCSPFHSFKDRLCIVGKIG